MRYDINVNEQLGVNRNVLFSYRSSSFNQSARHYMAFNVRNDDPRHRGGRYIPRLESAGKSNQSTRTMIAGNAILAATLNANP